MSAQLTRRQRRVYTFIAWISILVTVSALLYWFYFEHRELSDFGTIELVLFNLNVVVGMAFGFAVRNDPH